MHRYFSTPPIFSAPVANIDRELGIIQGVTIARIGPAKGHNGFVDRSFLLQIVDNAASKPAGIKARFGHPNMCSQALGTYLGRFKNYSYYGDQVKADLHLDDTAKNTPSGDLYTYVLDMAEKNPDMFGASIVFEIGESIFLEEEVDGEKVEKEYFRLKELRATDIVDEPAATDGLFSANTFPGIATQFLDENPKIMDLIFSKPDSVVEFLSNYLTNSKMNLSEKIKQNFAAFLTAFSVQPVEDPLLPVPAEQDNTLNTLFDALCISYPESFADVSDFTQLQKAESITAFLESQATKNSALAESFVGLKAEHETLLQTSAQAVLDLEAANSRISELTGQLSARPSIPLNVTDPALSLSANQEKDETGKQILSQLPKDLKRKLKKQS
ncbi:MAG: hypothetical protein Q7U54_20695 [Bacteroidales bacterium]|nr:hypothetical protein [Bacteroidales bacterium]